MADGLADAFANYAPAVPPAGYARMIDALRALQDRVTAALPPADVVAQVTRALDGLASMLQLYAVDERHQLAGHLPELPGRGQVMAPAVHVDVAGDDRLQGRVTFGRSYLGGNGAVHGGAIPLMFDEVLGRLALAGGRPIARTAFLQVDFRSVTPIEQELSVEGWFEREEGRKRYLRGTLHIGDRLCAEARALFVQLRPGAP